MADMSQAAPMGAQQDPNAAQGAGDDESNDTFSVTITCNADGTYTVSSSDSDDDQDDASGQGASGESGADDDSGSQTAKSLDDALQIAGQMIEQEHAEDAQEGQGDPNAPAQDPEAVWNQLAKKTDKSNAR